MTFGRDGTPLYVNGPRDNTDAIMAKSGCPGALARDLAGPGRQVGADLRGEVQVRLVAGEFLQALGDERPLGLRSLRQSPLRRPGRVSGEKVYITADMEGITGLVDAQDVQPGGRDYERAGS